MGTDKNIKLHIVTDIKNEMNFISLFSFLASINGLVFGACSKGLFDFKERDLQVLMENKLFGQHIVMKTVPNVIKNHLMKESPKKALLISFHGTTGVGKTHVSQLIA